MNARLAKWCGLGLAGITGFSVAMTTAIGSERLAFFKGADQPLALVDDPRPARSPESGRESGKGSRATYAEAGGGGERHALDRAMRRLEQRISRDRSDFEARLLRGLIHFRRGAHDEALKDMETLVEKAPEFHLAHLVRGDLLLSRSRAVTDVGDNGLISSMDTDSGDTDLSREALRHEARVRLEGYLESLSPDRVPAALLALGEDMETAILVDKSRNRLYLYENAGPGEPPRRIRDYYVSTGQAEGNKFVEGDLRTPEGVYFVQRYIADSNLPDLYGKGAFTLNYPNAWDERQGKTGYGIWLHGTESGFYSRPPLDSEGCVVMPNLDLEAIKPHMEPGRTPVIIAERQEWLTLDAWKERRAELEAAVEGWRGDWESMDTERYLAWYDEEFWSPNRERAEWGAYKELVLAGKTEQSIELDNLTLLGYPAGASDGERLVVARFRQDYDSNNYSAVMNKRLYLRRDHDGWNVLFEGPAD
ncbi:MAG: L,D-transpeptidase Cds6 family protein [Pseudomonadota bacterium]